MGGSEGVKGEGEFPHKIWISFRHNFHPMWNAKIAGILLGTWETKLEGHMIAFFL